MDIAFFNYVRNNYGDEENLDVEEIDPYNITYTLNSRAFLKHEEPPKTGYSIQLSSLTK